MSARFELLNESGETLGQAALGDHVTRWSDYKPGEMQCFSVSTDVTQSGHASAIRVSEGEWSVGLKFCDAYMMARGRRQPYEPFDVREGDYIHMRFYLQREN